MTRSPVAAALASERNSLCENFVTKKRVETLFGHSIHPSFQQRLDRVAKVHERETSVAWHVFNEEIQVAVRPSIATSERAKDTDIADAVAVPEFADLIGQRGRQRQLCFVHCSQFIVPRHPVLESGFGNAGLQLLESVLDDVDLGRPGFVLLNHHKMLAAAWDDGFL